MSGNNTTKGWYIVRSYHQTPNSPDRTLRHHNARNLGEAQATMQRLASGHDRTIYRLELMVILEEWWRTGVEFKQ